MNERLTFNAPWPGERGGEQVPGRRPAPVRVEPAATAVAPVEGDERRDWAFTCMLIFTAVLFLRPQDLFPPLEVFHLAELSAMAGLASLFIGRLQKHQSLTRLTPELAAIIAFGAVIVLTAPFSIWMGGAIGVFSELYSKVILVYLLTVNALNSSRRIERLTWLLVLALGYIGFRAMLDYARGVNTVSQGTRVRGSVGGIVQNPNDLALNMVAFLPLATFIALRASNSAMKRLTALGCVVFMLGAMVASGSRGGFIGFSVMILVMAIYAIRERPLFVVGGALAVLCALPVVPANYWNRIASITDKSIDDRGSADERKTLLRESVDAFTSNPLTGVGAGNFKAWNPNGRTAAWHETHNVIMQVASELGILGLAIFGFLVARAFICVRQTRKLVKRARSALRAGTPFIGKEELQLLDAHSSAMMASLAGWLVCAMFASVAYNWTFYYLLALAAAPRDILRVRVPGRAVGATASQRALTVGVAGV